MFGVGQLHELLDTRGRPIAVGIRTITATVHRGSVGCIVGDSGGTRGSSGRPWHVESSGDGIGDQIKPAAAEPRGVIVRPECKANEILISRGPCRRADPSQASSS